jgi:hypothetical protein
MGPPHRQVGVHTLKKSVLAFSWAAHPPHPSVLRRHQRSDRMHGQCKGTSVSVVTGTSDTRQECKIRDSSGMCVIGLHVWPGFKPATRIRDIERHMCYWTTRMAGLQASNTHTGHREACRRRKPSTVPAPVVRTIDDVVGSILRATVGRTRPTARPRARSLCGLPPW